MKKLKNITATEALRLIRLGFSDAEIIEADSQVSSESVSNVKQKKQTVKKERQKKAVVVDDSVENITAKEILRKIEEIKEKHANAVKKVDTFLNNKSKEKKSDNLLEKKEIEIKPSTTNDNVEDISSEDVDF
jgi:DNA-binding sugar fermentation-stimulating protein